MSAMAGEAATDAPRHGAAKGGVRWLLRAEGAAVFGLSLGLFLASGSPWWVFAVWFLAPDLSMIGFLAGPRVGAAVYNAAHAYLGPIALFAAAAWCGLQWPALVGLIWSGHIGFDRMLGYGLKYASGFRDTHLGRLGRGDT